MAKNLMSDPILACLAEIWVPKILDIVTNYHHIQFQGKRTTHSNSRKWGKTLFLAWFRHAVPKFGSVNDYHVKYQKKTNDPILRKFTDGGIDGRTDGQTDGQTDESDFIGRWLTDVERPTESEYIL